jgi:glutathione synthase/RimK-type ligase-like ATP-grasp enzyme
MSEVWLITRSLTNEIASNLTIEQSLKNDYAMTDEDTYTREYYTEPLKIKAGLNSLGVSCEFKRARQDLISPEYLRLTSNPPKLVMDCFPPWYYLTNHYQNLITLKQMGIKLVNDPVVHKLCTNKWEYQQVLEKEKIPTIKSISFKLPIVDESVELIESTIGYPVVIKPVYGSLSRGVMKCNNPDDVWVACSKIFKLHNKPKDVIVQKWVDHSVNGVLRIQMIAGNIVACSQRQPNYETDFFYSGRIENSIRIEYKLTQKLIDYCRSIYYALDKIDICAMDVLHDGENYVVCDINSPGTFRALDMCLNTDIGKLIAEHLVSKL